MPNFLNKLSVISLLLLSLLLAACGAGGSNASPTTAVSTSSGTVFSSTASKTSNHGLGQMIDQQVLSMSNGDLYVFGSRSVAVTATTVMYSPVLAKSTDGGATWTTTGVAQLSGTVPTLYGTASTTNGTTIVVTGGADGYQNDTTKTPPSYSQQIYFYNSNTNVWTTLSSPSSPFQRVNHAMAYNGAGTFYLSGGAQSYYDSGANVWRNSIFFSKWKSVDGGLNWTSVTPVISVNETTPMGNTGIYRHCMIANGDTLYLLGGKKAPIRTTAGGSIADSSEESAQTTVDKSTDGGLNWTTVSTTRPDAPIDSACAQAGTTLYSTGGLSATGSTVTNSLRKSVDNGATWTTDTNSTSTNTIGFRFGHSMTVRNAKLIIFGGNTAGTPSYKTDVIEATP